MGLRVATNIASINATRHLSKSQGAIQDSMEHLASGTRINKAADDAAGLAISENLKAQIRSIRQARRNTEDGISLVQTAEGGLNEIGNILVRFRELGIQAGSDTVGDKERSLIDKEVQQLKDELQRISMSTMWGSTPLLDGSTPVFDFQVGINNNPELDRIQFDSSDSAATIDALGLAGLDYTSKEGAQEALSLIDEAQTRISSTRATLGALQNRLVSTVENQKISEENMAAANSRIRDTEVAEASAALMKNQVLLQAGTATLAQANQNTAAALKLIG